MKFQIKARWSDEVRFECELDASFENQSYGIQRGAAIKLAVKAGANLAGANLAGANLAGANLAGANLAGADLADAYLAGANLAGANLAGADLADANLAGANLAGADLAGADLADAYLAGANLAGANLAGAYLADAYLADAYLAGADGEKLTLVGPRPALWFGPIGSERRTVYAYLTDRGIYVRAGCFFDTLEAFKAKVISTHGSNEHAKEYAAFTALAECHFALFPAEIEKAT